VEESDVSYIWRLRPTAMLLSVLSVVALSALALRLYGLDAQDIWWDEARNIVVAGRALPEIAGATELDIHPPVYFYLLHGWLGLAGGSAFAIRFLSLWFGVLLVPLSYRLGSEVGGRWAGLGAAVGAAFLPFLLSEAQEARMYTVTLAWLELAALALLAAVSLASGSRSRKWLPAVAPWAGLAFFSALALLTHYAAAFALVALWGWAAGWAVAGVGRLRRARLLSLGGSGVGAALLCLPGLPVALRQMANYGNPNLVVPGVGGYLAELWQVYGVGDHIVAERALAWRMLLAGVIAGGLLLATWQAVRARYRGRAPVRLGHWLLVLGWATIPLVVYYLAIRDRSTFASRYISPALPGWLLLSGLAVRGWAESHRPLGVGAILGILVALAPGLHGDLTDPRFFRDDTSGLATWMEAHAEHDDLILVDQRYPLGFYYPRWSNATTGLPPAEPAHLAPAQYLFVDINEVADRMSFLAQGRKRIFWVRWFESDTDPRGAVPFLLERFGSRLGEQNFRGYNVTWYAIPPGTQFELSAPPSGSQPLSAIRCNWWRQHMVQARRAPVLNVHPPPRLTTRYGQSYVGPDCPAQRDR
jgi:mannosyltransferase